MHFDGGRVGVFDSGLGGLTVVKEIKAMYPGLGIIYLGDSARVPYGTRSPEVIRQFAGEDVKFLGRFDVGGIVIACNTVSAVAVEEVKKIAQLPVWDVVSAGVAGAKRVTKNRRIGVIGTRGTVNSRAYTKALAGYEVSEQACPLFVPMIEEGITQGPLINLLIEEYLSVFRNKDIDTLILGCTHYPLLTEAIAKEVGEGVTLVNCGAELARSLDFDKTAQGRDQCFVTDLTERYQAMANRILDKNVKISLASL